LGPAITETHVKELIRHTQEIVFCFDGDRAGRQAAWRALETSIGLIQDGLQFRFLFIPEGEDPDTLVRKIGKPAFESLVDNAMSLPDFLFDSLGQKADIRKLDGQARLIDLVRPYLEKMPSGALRSLMTVRLAALAQMDVAAVASELGKNTVAKLAPKLSPATVSRERTEMPTIVRKAVALLLLKPSLAAVAGPIERLQDVQVPGAAFLHELLAFLRQSPHLHTTGSILERWRGRREGEYLAKLVAEEWHVPDEGMETEFCDALVRLEAQGYEQQVDNLLQKSRQNGLTDDEKEQLTRLLRVGKKAATTSGSEGTR
jgi:DNA primase